MAISKGNKWFHLRGVVLIFSQTFLFEYFGTRVELAHLAFKKLENKIKYSIVRLPKTNTISQMYLYKQQSRLALNNSTCII